MTVEINGYTVEIRAKYDRFGANHNTRANKHDAQAIVNTIACWAFAAADNYDRMSCHAIARTAREAGHSLHDTLEKQGYFKDVRLDA